MAGKIKFNSRGFHQLINTAGVRRAVHDAAYRIKQTAGDGTRVKEIRGGYGGGRPVAFVVTQPKTPEEAEAQRDALERAAHGA